MSTKSCKTYILYAALEAIEADDADNRVILDEDSDALLVQVWDHFDGDDNHNPEGFQRLFKVTVEEYSVAKSLQAKPVTCNPVVTVNHAGLAESRASVAAYERELAKQVAKLGQAA